MPLVLERLEYSVKIIYGEGFASEDFQRKWNVTMAAIETNDTAQQDLLDQIAVILGLTDDLQTAVDSAQASADAAASSAVEANSVASLTNSGVSPNPLTATDAGASATITIAAHTRLYGDGTTLAITGPTTITGLAYSTLYFVYYDDPTRADTTPAYVATTAETTAAQTGDRHLVGMVLTPAAAAGDTTGDEVRLPGFGSIIP